jgi:hypothetical protein
MVVDILLAGTVVEDQKVIIPVEVIPLVGTVVEDRKVIIPVVADLANPVVVDLANQVAVDLVKPVVVQLVSAEGNPVYNLVPIIREMRDYKKDRKEDEAAKRQTAA